MSAAGNCAVARVARASAPRTRAAPRRASRVVASASRSSDAPIGDVTRAVLSFHEGDRAGLGADDAVVPLASWAKRFGWDVETAERVLWECDVPTKGALQKGSSVGSDGSDSNLPSSLFQADDSAARVVDAADARVGLWVTHVFPDFVVRALLLAAETEEQCLSKRQALDAARAALQDEHPKAALSEAALARADKNTKNTNGAFADVLRSLRRRFPADEDAPFCVLTKKVKKQRVYTCVSRGTAWTRVDESWEAVFGLVAKTIDDAEKNASDPDAASLMRARREARRGTMRLPAVKRDESEKTDISVDAKDAARRARARGW